MPAYEFRGRVYRAKTELLDALAREYLSSGGMSDHETMLSFLDYRLDSELATECIEEWSLDAVREEYSWMAQRNIKGADIEAAFTRLRTNFDHIFPPGLSSSEEQCR